MARAFASGDFIEQTAPALHKAIAFRMRTTQVASNVAVVSRAGASGSSDGFVFLMQPAASGMDAKDGGVTYSLSGGAALNDGTWHSVVANLASVAGETAQFWVDGVSAGTATNARTWGNADIPYRIARAQDAFWVSYIGDIAEFAAWSSALTADEAASLSRGFSPRLIRPTALVSYMPLIREVQDLRGVNGAPTLSGTTVAAHPRVIG
jgi:hypothetical protein